MISGNQTLEHSTYVSTKLTPFAYTQLELSILQCLKASSRPHRAGYTKHTKNPYKLHDYSMRPTSKCLQTFLLLPTSALFPSKMKSESSRSLSFQNGLGAHGTIGYRQEPRVNILFPSETGYQVCKLAAKLFLRPVLC